MGNIIIIKTQWKEFAEEINKFLSKGEQYTALHDMKNMLDYQISKEYIREQKGESDKIFYKCGPAPKQYSLDKQLDNLHIVEKALYKSIILNKHLS
jgi:hypothetical protein